MTILPSREGRDSLQAEGISTEREKHENAGRLFCLNLVSPEFLCHLDNHVDLVEK